MMDGQRAIWKIRNDMKHNKPVQEREASRIDKAFRVMNLLKINKIDDSPTSVKMKTAKQRRDWLKRQYSRAGRALLQRHEDDKKEKTRQKHAQQISSNNAAVAQVLKSNTKQPSIMQALNPIAKRKREDTKSENPTTPAKPTTTESASIRPPSNNTKTKTRKKTSLLHKHHHQKGLLYLMKIDRLKTKKQRYRQKPKRRHIARTEKPWAIRSRGKNLSVLRREGGS